MTRSRNCHYIEINPVILRIRYTSLRSLLQLDIGKSCHLMSWKVILQIHQVIYLKALTRGLCFHSDLTTMLYNKGGKFLHYPLLFQHPPPPTPSLLFTDFPERVKGEKAEKGKFSLTTLVRLPGDKWLSFNTHIDSSLTQNDFGQPSKSSSSPSLSVPFWKMLPYTRLPLICRWMVCNSKERISRERCTETAAVKTTSHRY